MSVGVLPRRGYLGFAPGGNAAGVVVTALAPGGPAERSGLRVGDHLLTLDEVAVRDLRALRSRLVGLRAGEEVSVAVRRDEMVRTHTITAIARPIEKYGDMAVSHGVAYNREVRLRTISVAPPGAGPFPAVYFLQGYSCGTIERAEGAVVGDALRELVSALARSGYCVWRVEKRGAGDSDGPSCADATFDDERQDFMAGLAALFEDPRVDARRVALLGHSLGAMHAPALASGDRRVRAMALYGAGLRPWTEYLGDNARRTCALAGMDARATERFVTLQQTLWQGIVSGRSVEEVVRAHPELSEERSRLGVDQAGRLYERCEAYWRGVQRADIAGELAAAAVPTLVMWGTSDWLSARDEHEALADIAGGAFAAIDGADHAFFRHSTPHASFAAGNRGVFHPGVADALVAYFAKALNP